MNLELTTARYEARIDRILLIYDQTHRSGMRIGSLMWFWMARFGILMNTLDTTRNQEIRRDKNGGGGTLTVIIIIVQALGYNAVDHCVLCFNLMQIVK